MRGPGEGSVYQRQDGRWVAAVSLQEPGKKRTRRTAYAATRREAAQLLQQLQTVRVSQSETLNSIAERWIQGGSWSPSTLRTYTTILNRHLLPHMGDKAVNDLSPGDIQAYQRSLSGGGFAATTINLHRAVLTSILRMAMREKLIVVSPLASVRPPRAERFRAHPMNADEARKFLRGVAGEPLEALWTLAICLGLRSGELRALRWADIDFDARLLSVWNSIDTPRLGAAATKSYSSVRVLPLPRPAFDALLRHRHQGALSDGFVFTTRTGQPLDRSNVSRQFKRILRRLGIGDRRVHDLRHTFAALLIARGVELQVIANILGHSHLRTTADAYGFILPSVRSAAVESLELTLLHDSVLAA